MALVIALLGGLISFALWSRHSDPTAQGWMALVLMLTIVSSGICVICAASGWFLKR